MKELPDIRRTIKIDRRVTGKELADAFRKYAEQKGEEYAEEPIADVDGKRTVIIGVKSEYPSRCIMARSGENLKDTEIVLEDSYEKVGVGSSNEMIPATTYLIGYGKESVVKAVKAARDGLEKLL